MIKKGKETNAKYWGRFKVTDYVELDKPVECFSVEKGNALFKPTIVKIEWEKDPSDDKHDLWFPYWIDIGGKEKYGQFAPMIGQKALLELFKKAINKNFFNQDFLKYLKNEIEIYINTKSAEQAGGADK